MTEFVWRGQRFKWQTSWFDNAGNGGKLPFDGLARPVGTRWEATIKVGLMQSGSGPLADSPMAALDACEKHMLETLTNALAKSSVLHDTEAS